LTVYETEVSVFTARRSHWRAPAIVVLACLVTAVPILIFTLPPVMDFPNHLARIWLLGGGMQTPPLSAIYEARWWQASTNVAVDFFGTVLMRAAGLTATTKILLALMLIGPPFAAAYLNRAIFGRFHVWQLAGVMLVWCTTAVEGFLSFQIGLAAALLCASLPVLDRLNASRLSAIVLIAAALLLIHPFAVVFFGALICAIVIGETLPPLRSLAGRQGLHIVGLAAACMVPLALLFLFAPAPPGSHNPGTHIVHWEPLAETFSPKHLALLYFSPFISYRVALDLVFGLALAALVIWAVRTDRLRVHAGLLAIAVAFLVTAPFLPTNIGDGGALPVRFVIMAALMLLAGSQLNLEGRRTAIVVPLIIATVALARVGAIAWIWNERSDDVQQLERATAALPTGSPVLVLREKWSDTSKVPVGRLVAACPGAVCSAERHFGSLAVVWRHVFIPTLFAVPGQHPLGVRQPWARKAVYSSGIPYADEIGMANARLRDPYLAGWRNRFDYVLVLDADLRHTPLPGVQLVSDTGFARVYRVVHERNLAQLP
jgi:hypothetical protein